MPLTPYTGTWGSTQIAHLLRRTTFGVKKDDISFFSAMTMNQMVNQLLAVPTTTPSPPLNDYSAHAADAAVPAGQTWVNSPHNDSLNYWRNRSLRAWWMGQLVNSNRSIVEKMTLFWHNLVPISVGNVVQTSIWCYNYQNLLRTHSLGNYKTMIREITICEGMLDYLDGQWNNQWSPNENYARELQELFTIGKDSPPYYTQQDVVEAAKVLTGWRMNYSWTGIPFTQVPEYSKFFDVNWHDTSNKTFSSFYNTVIIGRNTATAGIDELNDLLNMIFAKNEVAKYIVRKLYRFFVYYKIDATIENDIITPLANTFRNNNYDILPVLQELLTSQHFYETQLIGAVIKNPMDFVASTARLFNVNFPTTVVNQYNGWRVLFEKAGEMQMTLGDPPNVAGWGAYYQSPQFHENWISPDTMRRRKEYISRMTNSNNGYNNGEVLIDTLLFTETLTTPSDPNLLIEEVLSLTHPIAVDASIKTQLKSILLSGQTADYYWSNAWLNYFNNKTNMTYRDVVKSRLKPFYEAVLNMAEFNLS